MPQTGNNDWPSDMQSRLMKASVPVMGSTMTIAVVSKLTPEARDVLIGAVKWLERISDRKDQLPASFMDNCDPAPLAKKIRRLLSNPKLSGG
jgi:hypothetical protein